MRVYNTALTATEIQTDMNTPIGGLRPARHAAADRPDGLDRDRGVADADQPRLDGLDRQRRRRRLPGRALPGRGLYELRPGRDPDRHELSTTPASGGDDLPLPRPCGRCGRQSQRLHGDPERDDAGHAAADGPDRAERDGGLRESDQSLAGRRRPTTSGSRATGSSAARARPARPSYNSRPRPAPPTTTPDSRPRRRYRYRVRAADAAGNLSGYTAIQNATTPDTQAPTAPTGLSATAVSGTQINLAWTGSTDNVAVANYRVERCQGAACTNFVQVGTPTGTTYNDTGLTTATTYRYRVRAADAAGNLSGYTAIENATTPDTQAPTAPTGLTATAASQSQIDLGWTASTDNVALTGYRVERCQGATCTNFAQIATPIATTYSDTGLLAAATYRYRVRAEDTSGNLSGYSSIQNATTPDTEAPTDPTGFSATAASQSQVNLAWTASTDNVAVSELPGRALPGRGLCELRPGRNPDRPGYNDAGLQAATTYRYRVRAADAAGNLSGYTAIENATTPDTQAPTDPTGLDATAVSASQIDLSWTASTDNVAVTGYRVERCEGAACTNFLEIGIPTGPTFSDTGLAEATTYRYRVRAADAAGNLSGYSAIQNAATTDTQPPTDPTGLTATAVSGTQIDLAWTGSSDNVAVANYRVERCQGAGCTIFVQVGTPTGTTFNDIGLHDGDDATATASVPPMRPATSAATRRIAERDDAGHAGADGADRTDGDRRLPEPDRPRLDGVDRQRRAPATGSSAARERRVRTSSRWQPRPRRATATPASWRRRPTATACAPPTRPAT